jgi:hypothetical protein
LGKDPFIASGKPIEIAASGDLIPDELGRDAQVRRPVKPCDQRDAEFGMEAGQFENGILPLDDGDKAVSDLNAIGTPPEGIGERLQPAPGLANDFL